MEIFETTLDGVLLLKPQLFGDDRGYFFESYNELKNNFLSGDERFVQDNQSMSHKNVLRGLHLQLPPYAQAKLVRVITGSVLDVVVDARKNSPTFGKHYTVELNTENNYSLFIPKGCLHGFNTLEDNTIFTYKCSNYYQKPSEITVMWNDKNLNINWKCDSAIISDKDKLGISFHSFLDKI